MSISGSMKAVLAVLVVLTVVGAGASAILASELESKSAELAEKEKQEEMTNHLVAMSAAVQWELSNIESATVTAAADLKGSPLNGSLATNALNDIVNSSSCVINTLTADRNGTVLAVEPERDAYMIGVDIGVQEPIAQLLEKGRPVISPLMYLPEGYSAVYIAYPVLDAEGAVTGVVSTMFRPDQLMENITTSLPSDDLSVMVLQEDGVVLYDPDPEEVGRNTFTDLLYENYTEVKEIAWRMVNESSGSGSYLFLQTDGGKEVSKTVMWTNIGMLDERWTVAVIGTD